MMTVVNSSHVLEVFCLLIYENLLEKEALIIFGYGKFKETGAKLN